MATSTSASEHKYLESQECANRPTFTNPQDVPSNSYQPGGNSYAGQAQTPAEHRPLVHYSVCCVAPTRSLTDAYLLLLLLGWFGAHHFYLKRWGWGVLYLLTFGVFGCGWLLDIFRLPFLVKRSNEKSEAIRAGQWTAEKDRERYTDDTYVLWMPFLGLLGFHHFYLHRPGWGLIYMFTLGGFGIGWLIDAARLPSLVSDFNQQFISHPGTEGHNTSCGHRRLDDTYIMWCPPMGLLGFHHFYLGRPGWGCLYLSTLGLFGIGWLVDCFRLPSLVEDYNRRMKFAQCSADCHNGTCNPAFTISTNIVGQPQHVSTEPVPSVYPPQYYPPVTPYPQNYGTYHPDLNSGLSSFVSISSSSPQVQPQPSGPPPPYYESEQFDLKS